MVMLIGAASAVLQEVGLSLYRGKRGIRLGLDNAGYPSLRYVVVVIAVLMITTVLAQLDRNLPALMVQPIRHHFAISDTEVSLFQGASFAVSYALAGLLFGRLVDRWNRRNLILIAVLTWSILVG